MDKSEYRAVSNFFHNTQKLTREELSGVVREVIGPIVREEVQKFLKTNAAETIIYNAVKTNLYSLHDRIATVVMDELLNERLTQQGRGVRLPREKTA
jgi:hypothetical protein